MAEKSQAHSGQVSKKDFIEIEFVGRIKETGQIFDTNIESEAKKVGLQNVKPANICVGEIMVVKGFDEALVGKSVGKEYSVDIDAKDAFGLRRPELIKTFSLTSFRERNVSPYPGMVLDLDGIIARVSSVTGGRVIVDFNYPLAGKNIVYEFKINKILNTTDEKLKVLAGFLFSESHSRVEGRKAVVEVPLMPPKELIDSFSKKVKSLLDLELEIIEKPKESSGQKPEKKSKISEK